MSLNNEFVVGIDIGTTSAICILDKNFNVLFLKSKREYSKSEIIDDILKFGKPLLICCDKKKIPKKIKSIAISLGVKVFHPLKDESEKKKIKLTKNYEYKNWHERDAIFSAIIGMKRIRRKLLEKENKKVEDIKVQSDNLQANNKNEEIKSSISTINTYNVKRLIEKIKELKEENKKLRELIERLKNQKQQIRYEYITLENKELEIENQALKCVIDILRMKLEKDEVPYIKLEEINEKFLSTLKTYVNDFIILSNSIEKFYILEKFEPKFVITEKNVENVWNLRIIVDNFENYEKIGKIKLDVLEKKWKEKILSLLNALNK
ncbi:MAG: DUF460 domain-containing protein [Candidatus Aenigmatarchaeota archaeon]